MVLVAVGRGGIKTTAGWAEVGEAVIDEHHQLPGRRLSSNSSGKMTSVVTADRHHARSLVVGSTVARPRALALQVDTASAVASSSNWAAVASDSRRGLEGRCSRAEGRHHHQDRRAGINNHHLLVTSRVGGR